MSKSFSKILITLFIVLVSVSTSYGQFGFGFKVGGASTTLTGVELEGFIPTPKMHLIAGGVANYSFGKRFALQTEVTYSGKGSAFQYYNENSVKRGLVTMDLRLGYIAVPLTLQFKMGDRDSYFHFDFGVVMNQLVHQKFTGEITLQDDQGNEYTEDFSLNQEPYKQDFGYNFGIGLVANGLMFDFAYELGIRDVFPPGSDGLKVRNRAFKVTVGYVFRY